MPRRNKTVPHERFAFQSSCQKKRRYPTEKEAQSIIDDMKLSKPNLTLSTYRCELCGGWHLTNKINNQH